MTPLNLSSLIKKMNMRMNKNMNVLPLKLAAGLQAFKTKNKFNSTKGSSIKIRTICQAAFN